MQHVWTPERVPTCDAVLGQPVHLEGAYLDLHWEELLRAQRQHRGVERLHHITPVTLGVACQNFYGWMPLTLHSLGGGQWGYRGAALPRTW